MTACKHVTSVLAAEAVCGLAISASAESNLHLFDYGVPRAGKPDFLELWSKPEHRTRNSNVSRLLILAPVASDGSSLSS